LPRDFARHFIVNSHLAKLHITSLSALLLEILLVVGFRSARIRSLRSTTLRLAYARRNVADRRPLGAILFFRCRELRVRPGLRPSGSRIWVELKEENMIPDYQTCMLPLLKFTADEKVHSLLEAVEYIAKQFKLNEAEMNELLPSGTQTIINNRVGWARTYLKKAGLLEDPKRARFQITQRGLDLLKEKPEKINIKYLERYEEFIAFRLKKGNQNEKIKTIEVDKEDHVTPEESIEFGYKKINESISEEIIAKIKECSPEFFEKLVVELLVKMGYGGTLKEAGQVLGKSGDGGIDGIIKEDKLGLDVIYIQAKRWENVVGRPEIQKFAGALLGQKAKKGIFITTSWFTADAMDFAKNIDNKIVLIDGELLTDLMIENDLGVNTYKTYNLKRIDSDYFVDE
jgi:restriction system protein